MPCESCSAQFTVFKRKRACCECDRYYCSTCIGRGVNLCGACKVLCTRPLGRRALDHLRVRDLQCFLNRQNISTRGCVEKEDLVNLVLAHVNSGDFSRRPAPQHPQSDFAHTFASLRGFTSNINNLLTSAFDIGAHNVERSQSRNRHGQGPQNNTSRVNEATSPTPNISPRQTSPRSELPNENFPSTVSPVSSNLPSPRSDNISHTPNQPPPPQCVVTDTSLEADRPSASGSPHVEPTETSDCVEVEDLDDSADWEFVRRPADPLPQDSGELLADNPVPLRSSVRASSDLDIPSRTADINSQGDTSSLKDSVLYAPHSPPSRIKLDDLKDLSQVDGLNIKQLKELLVLNRVDFKGCCERNELLERAKRLWKENTKSREDLEKAATEELCKICMDAPMECVMLECGHIATCIACGKRLSECPICRQYVVRVVRFFRS